MEAIISSYGMHGKQTEMIWFTWQNRNGIGEASGAAMDDGKSQQQT
ncbi:MAG TPA: hypothetical protein VFV68_05115 [Agriterribacter sp.]|nr:hypothetical protein [Agriterribacter sp.]